MRSLIIFGLSAAALVACTKSPEPAPTPAASAPPVAASSAMADMPGMDHAAMAASAATDAVNMTETPDGHMFHVLHLTDVQSVHLPVAEGGGTWSATPADVTLVSVDAGADVKMPDGALHHVIKVTPKASGNVDVKFERRATAKTTDPVVETRTMHFMIH
jgi:hypothetical protein